MPALKITSFKRILKFKEEEDKIPFTINKDSIVMNLLLYAETQNSYIQSFEKWIKTEHKQKVNFMKLIEAKSIIQAIKNSLEKKHRKTFIITTKSLTEKIQALMKANQSFEQADVLREVKFIVFVDKIQEIEPRNFWIKDICLISCKIQDIQKYIETELSNIVQPHFEEASSLCSEDQAAFEEQFAKKFNPISLPNVTPKKQTQNQGQIIFNDTPGVGTYEIKVQPKSIGSKSGTFSKEKRGKQ